MRQKIGLSFAFPKPDFNDGEEMMRLFLTLVLLHFSFLALAENQKHTLGPGYGQNNSPGKRQMQTSIPYQRLAHPKVATYAYPKLGNKPAENLLYDPNASGVLVRYNNGKVGILSEVYFSPQGVPAVLIGDKYRPLDKNDPIERKSILELAALLRQSRANGSKSPYKEFIQWVDAGFPPSVDSPPETKLGDSPEELAQLDAYNRSLAKYRELIEGEREERVNELIARLQEASKHKSPKRRDQEISAILYSLFAGGLEAPGVSGENVPMWEDFANPTALDAKIRQKAAANYSLTQVSERHQVIDAFRKKIAQQHPKLAWVVGRVKSRGAHSAYGILLDESFRAGEPRCATCGDLDRQEDFDEKIRVSIQEAMKATQRPRSQDQSRTVAEKPAGAEKVAASEPKKRHFKLGTCFYCKRASAEYAGRVASLRQQIQSQYPGATIEEYDAKAQGLINLGEVVVSEGDRPIVSRQRIYGDIISQIRSAVPKD